MYNFIFDRKSLALLATGLAFAGGLLFFAGLLVGVSRAVPYEARVASLPPPAPEPLPGPTPVAEPPIAEMEELPEPAIEADPVAEPVEPPAPAAPPEPEPPAITLPEPIQAAASPAPEPTASSSYAVQVGAFLRPENSEDIVRDLEGRGYQPYVEPLTNARGRLFHTVRIGRYAHREEAARAATEFRARERMAAIVQREGSL
jgi:cell division septation protein DedD